MSEGIRTAAPAPRRNAGLAGFCVRLWREKPLGTACSIIVLLLLLVVIFADVLAPFEYMEIHLRDRMQGSSAQYLLGTDLSSAPIIWGGIC